MPSHQPTITLHQATPTDLPTLIDLQFTCFAPVLVEQIANPDTPTSRQSMLSRHTQHMRDDPGLRIVKAVSDNSTTVVGFCMFYIPTYDPDEPGTFTLPIPMRSSRTDIVPVTAQTVDLEGGPEPRIAISRTNLPELLPYRWNMIQELVAESKGGRGAGYVRYMCVDPAYRRYGIGRAMMRWGCDLFDEHGVDGYLEATAEGEPLYRCFGYEKVGEHVVKVDGEAREKYACMWRPARIQASG